MQPPVALPDTALLEVCVDSVASARAALAGGADRLELCSALIIGGLTPSTALFDLVRAEAEASGKPGTPINCLIRPRFGDFLYTDAEIEQQRREIAALREHGADGFVIGCLTADGALDETKTGILAETARGCRRTLHRAFDVAKDADATLAAAARLGFDTVLTSGQAASAWQGRALLAQLAQNPYGIAILAGGGVNAEVITKLRAQCPITQFHLSGKTEQNSGMVYRRPGVPMGLPGLDEFTVWQTEEAAVRAAAQALHG